MKTADSYKPRVAQLNQERAIANIACKLRVLKQWASHGIPTRPQGEECTDSSLVLEFFPRSSRQFNAWDGSQNTADLRRILPALSRNANDTLRRHASLKADVAMVIEALQLRAEAQRQATKPLRITKLKTALKAEEQLRALLEGELVSLRRQLGLDRRTREGETDSRAALAAEYRQHIDRLTAEIEQLRAENAVLTKKLSKVAPLRRA